MSQLTVLSPQLAEQHAAIRDVLDAAIALTRELKAQEQAALLADKRAALDTAALFVIVGEVKSGKSSFINALLGQDVCEVAPYPCTARIQELVYGNERSETALGEQWSRLRLPFDVLKQITIVDTPGTNSIIKNHQTLTERYIPQSDLVIFVFFAKNPHTATPWDLLSLIRREWHRKVVFVLQQSDVAAPEELQASRDRTVQYAHERGIQEPQIFTVSALRERERMPDSGFTEFRDFLRRAVESGEIWRLKFEGARDVARQVLTKLQRQGHEQASVLEADRAFYESLVRRVASRKDKAERLRALVVDGVCGTYNTLVNRLREDFTDGLRVGAVLRRSIPLVRDKSFKSWRQDLQAGFEREVSKRIEADIPQVSKDLAEEIRTMLDELEREIDRRRSAFPGGTENLKNERAGLLEKLQEKIEGLRVSDVIGPSGLSGGDIGTLTLTGGGVAMLGAVIAVAAKLTAFEAATAIFGGSLSALGVGLLTSVLVVKRGGILRDLSDSIEKAKQDFRQRLDTAIAAIFDKLFHEINHAIGDALQRNEEQSAALRPLVERLDALVHRCNSLVQTESPHP
jgi:hypothetical protein